jgi:hypothetical protein
MSAADMIVFDSLARSNIPYQEKSMIRRWADAMTGGEASNFLRRQERRYGVSTVETFVNVFRQAAEQPAMGAILGVLAAKRMLDVNRVPVDFASGALLSTLGLWASLNDKSYGSDLVNLGTAGFTVFSFRKTFALFASDGASMAGEWDSDSDGSSETGEDPIINAAKNL